jgi:hypothetical protein
VLSFNHEATKLTRRLRRQPVMEILWIQPDRYMVSSPPQLATTPASLPRRRRKDPPEARAAPCDGDGGISRIGRGTRTEALFLLVVAVLFPAASACLHGLHGPHDVERLDGGGVPRWRRGFSGDWLDLRPRRPLPARTRRMPTSCVWLRRGVLWPAALLLSLTRQLRGRIHGLQSPVAQPWPRTSLGAAP